MYRKKTVISLFLYEFTSEIKNNYYIPKIPEDSIAFIMTDHPSLEDTLATLMISNELSKKASSSVREYLCYKAYLDAQEGFQEWFSHFHQGKPAPLEDLPSYATFTEKVAHDHKKAQYNAELDRWKCTMQHHTKVNIKQIFNFIFISTIPIVNFSFRP